MADTECVFYQSVAQSPVAVLIVFRVSVTWVKLSVSLQSGTLIKRDQKVCIVVSK